MILIFTIYTYLEEKKSLDSFLLLHYSSKEIKIYTINYKNNNYTFNFSDHESNIQVCH